MWLFFKLKFQIGSAVGALGAGYYCSSGLCVPARCNISSTTAPQNQCQQGRGITNFCCPFNLECNRDWVTSTDSSATMNRCLRDGWGAGKPEGTSGCQCPNGYKVVNDPALGCKCFLQCSDNERCDYEQPSKQPPTCCWKNIDFWSIQELLNDSNFYDQNLFQMIYNLLKGVTFADPILYFNCFQLN